MQSSPFGSLQPALDGVTLSTSITGLNHPDIIVSVHVVITLDSLVTNLVSVEFQVQNPLDTDMVIEFVQADSGLDGTVYAFFGQSFDSFIIPPGQTVGSGLFPNVLLTQGALASLDIIPRGMLDISAVNTVRIGGPGGYQIPWLKLEQKGVPTTYDLALSLSGAKMTLDGLLDKAKDILSGHHSTDASSAAASSTASVGASTSGVVSSGSGDGKEPTATKSSTSAAAEETTEDSGKSVDAPAPTTTAAAETTADAVVKASPAPAPAAASASSPATETASPAKSSDEPSDSTSQ